MDSSRCVHTSLAHIGEWLASPGFKLIPLPALPPVSMGNLKNSKTEPKFFSKCLFKLIQMGNTIPISYLQRVNAPSQLCDWKAGHAPVWAKKVSLSYLPLKSRDLTNKLDGEDLLQKCPLSKKKKKFCLINN